jgi:sulfite reductase (NADPH) flavoprotein alpha-component
MIKLPEHAPLTVADRERLETALSGLSGEQHQWLSGYLAGVAGAVSAGVPAAAKGTTPLTILFGTESGNCEELADRTAKKAKKSGFKPKMLNMSDAKVADLPKAENVLVIVSTWGDGEPPETAERFYKELMNGSPGLEGVQFSVLALGDTSYDKFCQTGKEIDERFSSLGANRLVDRKDCDVDYDECYDQWLAEVLPAFGSTTGGGEAAAAVAVAPTVAYGKRNPFPAEVTEKVLLSGQGSQKETWHIEFDLEGSGLTYEVGDVLGVKARNSADVVDAVLAAGKLDGGAGVTLKDGAAKSLREALIEDLDVTTLSRKFATGYAELTGSKELAALADKSDAARFNTYSAGRQIVDLLEDYPSDSLKGTALVKLLRPLPPRLYSIASSLREHPGEVHLTVAAVRYESHGKDRKGVASTALADLYQSGDRVPVFVQPNKRFRLPDDDATPIIMVGPGTGVAPFRAFVEERGAREAGGESWLFFGDQHYSYDFAYQLEWQDHLKSGALTRLDVAFSRDQPEKVYVQYKLLEKAADVYQWLERGAHFYVCGDADRMAGDVHEALAAIVQDKGGKSKEEAEAYLEALKKDGRYQRDVY